MQQCLRQIVAVSAGALLVDVRSFSLAVAMKEQQNKDIGYTPLYEVFFDVAERECRKHDKDQDHCLGLTTDTEYEFDKEGKEVVRKGHNKCEFEKKTQECHVSLVHDQYNWKRLGNDNKNVRLLSTVRKNKSSSESENKKVQSSNNNIAKPKPGKLKVNEEFKEKLNKIVLERQQAPKSKWSTGKKVCLCIMVGALILAFLAAIISYLHLSQYRCTNNADSEF